MKLVAPQAGGGSRWITSGGDPEERAGLRGRMPMRGPLMGVGVRRESRSAGSRPCHQGGKDPRMAYPQKNKGGPVMLRPRTRWYCGVATLVVCAIFVCGTGGTALAGTAGQSSGTVRASRTGEPIGLASVQIPDLKRGAVSDPQGNFFILNLPPGKDTVRVALMGYVPQAREGVEVIQDFVARIDWSLEPTVLTDVAEVVVTAERPLIQKDVTGTTRFLSGEDISHQPLRGYQDAGAQQAGVVNYRPNFNLAGFDNEA